MKRNDLTGQRFGRLTVKEQAGVDSSQRRLWRCQCDCGNVKLVCTEYLRSETTRSCGCLWRESITLPQGQAIRNSIRSSYKRKARIRGLEWLLTDSQFDEIIGLPCHYCGDPSSNCATPTPVEYEPLHYNGIDRKNNSKGYVMDNIVPCCEVCNKAKLCMSYDDFISYLTRAGRFQLGIV